MKKLPIFLYVIPVVLAGCKNEEEKTNSSNPHAYVNTWIHSNMKTYYLWEEYIPASSQTNAALAPADYFASLLHKPDDRFSWIQENYTDLLNSLSGVQREAGYDYSLYLKAAGSQGVVGVVTYIKPHSPAAQTALRRGDIFVTINGEEITASNYRSLIGKLGERHTLGLADHTDLNTITSEITMDAVEYKEHPVFLDTIYQIEGRRIGYLVYNFFAVDDGGGSGQYNSDLNAVFGKFKAGGISDLIIDLRYNGGGAVSTAIALASMIGSQSKRDVFGIAQYNAALTRTYSQAGADWDKDFFVEKVGSENVNQIGMTRLYVISSNGTASASELIINGLRPYISVHIVGDTTYGKNVGSYSLYKQNDAKNKWGMQPITVKFANRDGSSDYGKGFAPDVYARETADGHPLRQLGDVEEALLRRTLDLLLGRSPAASAMARSIAPQSALDREIFRSIDRTPARRNMWVE